MINNKVVKSHFSLFLSICLCLTSTGCAAKNASSSKEAANASSVVNSENTEINDESVTTTTSIETTTTGTETSETTEPKEKKRRLHVVYKKPLDNAEEYCSYIAQYDSEGNLEYEYNYTNEGKVDPQITHYEGNVTTKIKMWLYKYNFEDVSTYWDSYEYDVPFYTRTENEYENGLLVKTTYENAYYGGITSITTYSYDGSEYYNKKVVNYESQTEKYEKVYEYTRDERGNILQTTLNGKPYDETDGRVLRWEYNDKNDVTYKELNNGNIYKYEYTYDQDGRTIAWNTTAQKSDGTIIEIIRRTNSYDEEGNRSASTVIVERGESETEDDYRYEYNEHGDLLNVYWKGRINDIWYDEQLHEEYQYEYNDRGDMTYYCKHPSKESEFIQRKNYEYDEDGYPVKIEITSSQRGKEQEPVTIYYFYWD